MASNDYYAGFDNNHNRYDPHQDTSYQASSSGRLDHDLPALSNPSPSPLPHKSSEPYQDHNPSPFNTPFDEDGNSYVTPHHSTQHLVRPDSYTRAGAHDPFCDSQSIPLQSNPGSKQYGDQGDGSTSPTMGMGHVEQYAGAGAGAGPDGNKMPPKKNGWFTGKIPYAVYLLSVIQIIVFIVEIVKNGKHDLLARQMLLTDVPSATLTGSPIELHPSFNPMIGPSPYVLINMGARYVPCMREYDVPGRAPLTVAEVAMPCPNATTLDAACTLAQLCGFGLDLTKSSSGVQPQPNQWYRFIIPIFLHGGLIHIVFNMLLQLTLARDVERQIGTLRFCLVYFSAGIFGFVLGGNFSPNGILSTGCSGSLFGIIAILLLDLFYTWKTRRHPGRDLLFIMLDVVIAFVIGLLPGLDNFSHIGGFLTGLVLGVFILRSPDTLRERIGLDDPPYAAMGLQGNNSKDQGVQGLIRKPVGFFKGRKPLWWAWWLIRAGALAAIIAGFIVLVSNFYTNRHECSWCKYLNCLVSASQPLYSYNKH
jgi:membrane associated rhomboid family serine protease